MGSYNSIDSVSGPERAPENTGARSSSSGSQYLFQANYILEVMKYTNIAMDRQSSIVQLQGEVASLGTKMMDDLATISQFISQIQSQAHSGGGWYVKFNNGTVFSPNMFNGLTSTFYQMYDTGNEGYGGDSENGCVSPTYQSLMTSFISAVKDLYYSSPTGVGPTVGDLATITNPSGGPNFNMLDYFGKIQNSYTPFNQVFSGSAFDVVTTNVTAYPSLLQQYMYAKSQLVVATATPEELDSANGDISKLVDFNFGDSGFDSDLGPFMNILSSLNLKVAVANSNTDATACVVEKTSSTILSMIVESSVNSSVLYNNVPGDWASYGKITPGLYCAFSYMAYNYAWTKNPNMSLSQQDSNEQTAPIFPWGTDVHYCDDGSGVPQGDPLSTLYANVNTAQSNMSASGSTTGSDFQQDVNNVQQIDGAAGNIVSGFSQGQQSLITNFKNA